MTREEIDTYLNLHSKAMQENFWDKTNLKWCDKCNSYFSKEDFTHWRKTKDSLRCRQKDKDTKKKELFKRHNNIDSFIYRRFYTIRERCTKENNIRFINYKGKLNMSKEDFLTWGKQTLPSFLEKNNISTFGHGVVQVDRIDSSLPYKEGNLQWITRQEHTLKSIKEQAYPVNQLSLDHILIQEFPSLEATRQEGFNPSLVKRCCVGKERQHKGFLWEFSGKINKRPSKDTPHKDIPSCYCSFCKRNYPFPETPMSDAHWSWYPNINYRVWRFTNGVELRGIFRCKAKKRASKTKKPTF